MATAKFSKSGVHYRLPDIPQREPDEVTNIDHLHKNGSSHFLGQFFGNPETTLVEAERYIILGPNWDPNPIHRYPDLLIAFDVDTGLYRENNGYVITEQGKPPEFVLEVASPSTAPTDLGAKRNDYATLGIGEYWRFDSTGGYYGAPLAGDKLVDGVYVPITIGELDDGRLQGYSGALNLYLRWETGELGWYDPATGQHIPTYDYQLHRAEREREARIRAETRVRELEAENRRLRSST